MERGRNAMSSGRVIPIVDGALVYYPTVVQQKHLWSDRSAQALCQMVVFVAAKWKGGRKGALECCDVPLFVPSGEYPSELDIRVFFHQLIEGQHLVLADGAFGRKKNQGTQTIAANGIQDPVSARARFGADGVRMAA